MAPSSPPIKQTNIKKKHIWEKSKVVCGGGEDPREQEITLSLMEEEKEEEVLVVMGYEPK